jgi:hypothetical protein
LRKAGQAADDRRLARAVLVLCYVVLCEGGIKALVAAHTQTRKDEIGKNKDGRDLCFE